MSAEVESLYLNKEPAWHGLGNISKEALTSADTILTAGLDWLVEKRQILYECGEEVADFPGQYATVRATDDMPLGIVSDRYSIVQNHEAFKWIDQLLGEGITFESAGSLKNGKLVFILAHMPAQQILGDEIRPYFMFSNWHDGTGTMDECLTAVRVVCWNTWNAAMKGASRKFSVRHTGDMEDKQKNVAQTLKISSDYMDRLAMTAETLEQTRVSKPQVLDIINQVWPELKPEEQTPRKIANREAILQQFATALKADDLSKFRGTAWCLQQAIAAFDSHLEPVRQTVMWKENHFINLNEGNGIQDTFLKAIEKVCGVAV